jgi:hypothetical protein
VYFAADQGPLVTRTESVCAIGLGDHPREMALDLRGCVPEAKLTGGDTFCDHYAARVIDFTEERGTS